VSQTLGIGLRIRTARATAVVLGTGDASLPRLIVREELDTSDPAFPESRQPHHAGLDLPHDEATRIVERAVAAVMRASEASLAKFVTARTRDGSTIAGIGLVISSHTDPASLGNPHMRAHASEGRLFHDALAAAAGALGIEHRTWLEKTLTAQAATLLGLDEAACKRELAAWGKQAGPPWRAQEKAACLAAWTILATTRA
jgi:hypothetical protein